MRTLKYLLQKEFIQVFRNTVILRMILALPIVQLIVLPLAADFEIKNINISVVDGDHSTFSRKLRDKILASGYFRLNDLSSTYRSAFHEFEEDHSDLILEIPGHFEKDLVKGEGAPLYLAANAINGTKASVGSAYLMRIINDYRSEISNSTAIPGVPIIDVVSSNRFNPHLNYPLFMVPGILVVLVTMVATYMCAINIVKEKEIGTIEQINVTPVKKIHFILGKLIPFWVIGMFVFSVGLFGVARLVYGIIPVGPILVVYCFLALYLVTMLGIGLLISTYSTTQQQAMSLAFFCMMIFMLMSGLFTPVESMPEWAKWIARLNPVTYFIEFMRMVVLKGSGFSETLMHFVIMAVMAVFFNVWAAMNYRKTT